MNHKHPLVLDFCFHDIVRIHITTNHPDVSSFFAGEYAYHRTDTLDPSTNLPLIELDFSLNSKIPPGFVRHAHKLLARWGYQMEISSRAAKISVVGNRLSIPMVHHMMLHSMLRYFASRQGVLMLHSGVVSRNGSSIIFTGPGGAGKTTTTSLVLASDKSWKLHADDYVFLKLGPVSLTYQTNLHVYQNLVSILPEVADSLSFWELLKLRVFGLIRQLSRENIKWSVRVPVSRIWFNREIENVAIPVAIIFLKRPKDDAGLHPIADTQSIEDAIIEMNFYEARHFIHLLQKGELFDDHFLSEWKQNELRTLRQLLTQVPVYSLRLPAKNKADYTQKEVLEALKDLTTSEK